MPTTEQLDGRIDGVEALLTTKTRELSTQILKIEEKLGGLPAQITTIIESQKRQEQQNELFTKGLKDLTDSQTALELKVKGVSDLQTAQAQLITDSSASIAELMGDRTEFKALWTAQKEEARGLQLLRDNQGDPEIQALLSMKGLDVVVSRAEIARLQGDKNAIKAALLKFPDTRGGKYARMLANLGYAYILMAQNYKLARDHVTAVIAEKTATDILLSATLEVLKAAVAAGLSALTAGVTGIISDKLLEASKLSAKSGTLDFQDDDGVTRKTEVTEKEDPITGRKIGAAVVSSPVESGSGLLSGGLDGVVGNIGGLAGFVSRASQLLSTDAPENTTMEPYEFFIDKEAQLRKAAAMLASCTDPKVLDEVKVQLDQEYSLKELESDPNWKFFFEISESFDEIGETWEMVGALLSAYMRRLCWRLFCRSQWNNVKYSYTITVVDPSEAETISAKDDPSTEWNYKTWNWSGLGWPRHWEKICSDFRGPEHDPDHKFTVNKGLVNRAHKLLEGNTWISMAATQCCQVKRYDTNGINQGWAIDLEKFGHIGGEEGAPQPVPNGWTDWDLVYGDIRGKAYVDPKVQGRSLLEDYLQKIRVHSGMRVQVAEIRFGKGGEDVVSWTKATGKKGKLAAPNSPDSAIPIVKGMKITTLIKRTSSQGNVTSSKYSAKVHLYEALKEKHDGTTDCAKVKDRQLCWYCLHTPKNDRAKEDFKKTYRLREVDHDIQKSRVISNVEVSYVNFPSDNAVKTGTTVGGSKLKTFADIAGLYCIKLDPRKDLQYDNQSAEYHVTDEWWFKVLDKGSPDQAPNPPKVSRTTAKGDEKISGTYVKRNTDPKTSTLIHVFINGKMYGPKEIPKEGPNDAVSTNPVNWEIEGIPKLVGGEKIVAKATWPANGTDSARQSDDESFAVVMTANPPETDHWKLQAGMSWVTGICDAVEGLTIRVYVADAIDDRTPHWGEVKLLGERVDLEAEKDTAGTEIRAAKPGVIRWQVNGPDRLLEGKQVAARAFFGGFPVSAMSTSKPVIKLEKPEFTPPKPGETEVKGKAKSGGGLQIALFVREGQHLAGSPYEEIAGPMDGSGKISWHLGKTVPLPPFKPGQDLQARIGFVKKRISLVEVNMLSSNKYAERDYFVDCSEPTLPVVKVEKLAAPVVGADVEPGVFIKGTATVPQSLAAHSEVWVRINDEWIEAAKFDSEPDVAGAVAWTLEKLQVLKPGDKIKAQVFGKAGKDGVQAEFSDESAEVTVETLDGPELVKPAVNATEIKGKAKYIAGAAIRVMVGADEMHQDAEITPKNPSVGAPVDWKIPKLKAKNAKKGSRVDMSAAVKVKAAIFVGTVRMSDWTEKTI